jgi:hypothetical protein
VRAQLDGERSLKNLFEQIALVHGGRGADAEAFALVQQDNLAREFAGEVELVGDDDHGIAIFRGEAAESDEQVDLRADVQVESGLVEEKKKRLLREGAREDHALLFAAGDF